jgi:hypothetical protein
MIRERSNMVLAWNRLFQDKAENQSGVQKRRWFGEGRWIFMGCCHGFSITRCFTRLEGM